MVAQVDEIDDKAQVPDTPLTRRLVIRIKLPPEGAPPAPALPPKRQRPMVILGLVVVVLTGLGVILSGNEPPPAPAVPGAETVAVPPAVAPVEPEVQAIPVGPPMPINEVIPDVPSSARNTISGTIVVAVRVTLDKQGTVINTSTVVSGPSPYFLRLATEAARKWTFTASAADEQRTMKVSFYFRSSGTTADAEP